MFAPRVLRLLGTALLLIAAAAALPTAAAAQGFYDRAERVRQMLGEARELETRSPADAEDLRQAARREFDQLRGTVENLGSDLDLFGQDISDFQRSQAWGAFWSSMEGVGHTAIAADRTVDLAVILSNADRNPQVKALMKTKGYAYTAVDTYNAYQKEGTGAAVTEAASGVSDEIGVLVDGVEGLEAAERGDTEEAIRKGFDVIETIAEDFAPDSPEVRALKATNKAADVKDSLDAAGQAFLDARTILDNSERMTEGLEDTHDQLSGKLDRMDGELGDLALDHPELADPDRLASDDQELFNLLRFLEEEGTGLEQNMTPHDLDPTDRDLEGDDPQRDLDRVADQIADDNRDAELRLIDGQWVDDQIADQLDQATQLERDREQRLADDAALDDWTFLDDPDHPDHDDAEEDDEADHCAGGAFQCPNGLPWPECGHSEKYDCPPAEHADEARAHKQQSGDGDHEALAGQKKGSGS